MTSQSSKIISRNIQGKILYAIAAEVYHRGQWKPDMINVHATDAGEARFIYTTSNNLQKRIVAVAPAVGFFCDDNGENLEA